MELMSDEQWKAIQDNPKLPLQERAELFAKRWLTMTDWDNLQPEFAAVAQKTLHDDAVNTVLKAGSVPFEIEKRRPRDIMLP